MLTFLILLLLTGASFFCLGAAHEKQKKTDSHYLTIQCPYCKGLGKYRAVTVWECEACEGKGYIKKYIGENAQT